MNEFTVPIEFMPHGHCYFWQPDVLWTQVITNGLIALAYFAIPLCLVIIYRKWKDVWLRWMLALFAVFIVSCGATHVMDVVTIWQPLYRLDGAIRMVTALSSVATAIALLRITPSLLTIPTAQEWQQVNAELNQQVAQLKTAEQTLQQSENARHEVEERYERLTDIFDSVTIHKDLNIVFANPAAARLLGAQQPDQLIGQSLLTFVPPADAADIQNRMLRLEKGGRIPLVEQKLVKTDGSEVIVETSSVIFSYNGKTAIQTVARDITERKRQEALLQASEAKFRRIFESDIMGIVFWEMNGNVTDANKAFLEMTAYAPEDLVQGINWRDLTPSNVVPVDQSPRTQLAATDTSTPVEKEFFRKDGSRVPVLLGSATLEGNRESGVSLVLDITQLKKVRLELERRAQELARSNEELEQFAYITSHDLQEPLRTMAGFANLLEKKYKHQLDDDAKEFIAFIVDAAERMKKLINNLLEYSRISAKQPVFAPTDFNAALERTIEQLQHKFRATDPGIQYSALPTLPADSPQIGQLFSHLLSNAVKFRDDKPLEITVSATERDTDWLFAMRDTGIGLEMTYANKIFQVFQRLHARDAYEGTGIGLAICKKIVERHGGAIWVEAGLGTGATFYFTIAKQL